MHGQVHTLSTVFTLVRGGCDNHWCHYKNPRWEMDWDVNDVMSWSDRLGILVIFEKKQLVETKRVDIWAGWGQSSWGYGMHRALLGEMKSQHSKNCNSLSSCKQPKSQEGNKSFEPEVKHVVSVSGFICMWTFYISVYFTYSYFEYVTYFLLNQERFKPSTRLFARSKTHKNSYKIWIRVTDSLFSTNKHDKSDLEVKKSQK